MPTNSNVPETFKKIRTALSMSQRDFAQALGCAPVTIQKIEQSQLGLSKALAAKISAETGVDARWLLHDGRGEIAIAPEAMRLHSEGQVHPFTRVTYELIQAQKQARAQQPQLLGDQVAAELVGIVAAAEQSDRDGLAVYRITEFVRTMKQEFGLDEGAMQAQMLAAQRANSTGSAETVVAPPNHLAQPKSKKTGMPKELEDEYNRNSIELAKGFDDQVSGKMTLAEAKKFNKTMSAKIRDWRRRALADARRG